MKFIKSLIYLVLPVCLLSCKKDKIVVGNVSAVTIINSVVGANPIVVDFLGVAPVSTYYNTANQINYGSFYEYSLSNDDPLLTIYQITDTTHTVFKHRINIQPSKIYSLFLTGLSAENSDTLFVKDNLPHHALADSTIGIRFVNLSPGSNPVSVDIQGNPSGSEVASLAYKSLTDFKIYSTKGSINQYTFEFRDVATINLLASYTINGVNYGANGDTNNNPWRNRNFTIVLTGSPGVIAGNNAQFAFLVNNY